MSRHAKSTAMPTGGGLRSVRRSQTEPHPPLPRAAAGRRWVALVSGAQKRAGATAGAVPIAEEAR